MNTRLRDLREDNDLTQEQAAIIGCISKKSYERYENGVRDIPMSLIPISDP
ncbi:MAG: helix-turn-helix domain-containing protein, partial [Eubacterium sp.]|nr:helix-turn-helix domain-containing protein [Eubacterium sp.]